MTTPTNKELREFILDSFNESELDSFCFDHFREVKQQFSANMSLLDRVVVLIEYCQRHGKIAKLLKALEEERPSKFKTTFSVNDSQNSLTQLKTGLGFVRVPEGEFLFGEENVPIYLPEFWISKTPVTHSVYQRFIDVNPWYKVPFLEDESWARPYNWDLEERTFPLDKAEHPVVLVSWYDSVAFCDWAGLQLPTEEQWEKAARGTDGRTYPWGNNDPTNKLCNFDGNVGVTTPVGFYSPQGNSSYGCVDMSGNAWEWCLNKFENPNDTAIDQSGDRRVLRGGSWNCYPRLLQVVERGYYPPNYRGYDDGFGFRVVIS